MSSQEDHKIIAAILNKARKGIESSGIPQTTARMIVSPIHAELAEYFGKESKSFDAEDFRIRIEDR